MTDMLPASEPVTTTEAPKLLVPRERDFFAAVMSTPGGPLEHRPRPAPTPPRRDKGPGTPDWVRRYVGGDSPKWTPPERAQGAGGLDRWTPVYDHGCGWRECPLCGPAIEAEIEAKHRRKVASSWPSATDAMRASEFIGEAYGTGAPRGPHIFTKEERRAQRGDQNRRKGIVRIERTLTIEDRAKAIELITARPIRRNLLIDGPRAGRAAWASEVWLELLNPSLMVAARERKLSIEDRVRKAVQRAEARLHQRKVEIADHRPTFDMLEK